MGLMTSVNLPERLALSSLPTPVEPLDRLGTALDLDFLVKRDDLTGSHLAGNKIRKLDFILADALAKNATHVITCGGMQSNHARATALAATTLGMSPVLLLRTPNGQPEDLPSPPSGNVLLSRMSGARIVPCSPEAYRNSRAELMLELADELERGGARPYLVPEGGSNALGALGYVECAKELLTQVTEPPDLVVVATGSGGTLAGLALGFEYIGAPTKVVGVAVCDDAPYFEAIVERIAAEAHEAYGLPLLSPGRFMVLEGFQGLGYGLATDAELDFLLETLRLDGLALDPVYTNKAFLGLVATLGTAPRTLLPELGDRVGRVVFIHTGGIFGVFPFAEAIAAR